MPANGKVYIYTLDDPQTDEARYVGKTTFDLKDRLRGHLKEKRKTPKCFWIQSLKKRGLKPVIEEIESCSSEADANEAERFWICSLRFLGCRLLNLNEGGDGGPPSPEVRAKMRESARRRFQLHPVSAETRARMVAARLGTKRTLETRAKMSAASMGKPKSLVHAVKCREALIKGRQTAYTPEAMAKKIVGQRGRKNTPETIAKMRERRLAYWQKISTAARGRKHSEATKAKCSQTRKVWWQSVPQEARKQISERAWQSMSEETKKRINECLQAGRARTPHTRGPNGRFIPASQNAECELAPRLQFEPEIEAPGCAGLDEL